ncbi:hypothetical protein CQ001_11260 [Erwinia billingiae]|nr:hypothetical protein [Erwinia billingiae]MCX0497775.1 virulence promoting factor [Erwinia billingiae]PRB59393.1 hypothetical protein CQ001_11260 [Erwinia billingiae]QBR48990.1 virulence promoting factor [Erwinia sp. QL-Z3]QEW30907.1 virulence promoting factor [Erwinia billingiae]
MEHFHDRLLIPHIKELHNVILERPIGAAFQRFMLNIPLADGLLLRVIPAIVVNCSASLKFEARNV